MGLQDFFTWRSQTAAATSSAVSEDELPADTDEPPDHKPIADFHKSAVKPQNTRAVSLLTKAFEGSEEESIKRDAPSTTDLTRRRSMMSNASLASTAELTSDGGLTSPARTNTPSPPPPATLFTGFAPFSFNSNKVHAQSPLNTRVEIRDHDHTHTVVHMNAEPIAQPAPRKRSIQFACDARKNMAKVVPALPPSQPATTEAAPKRKCMIRFACTGPKDAKKETEKQEMEVISAPEVSKAEPPKVEVQKRPTKRSPSIPRKSPRPAPQTPRHRDSTGTVRRASQSPVAVRVKPKYIIADEATLQTSEATRFHEFASGEIQEDEWITRETEIPKEKLTINDTLKKENAIRKLGNEAEEEMEDEDLEDDGDDFDDDEEDEEDEEDDDNEEEDGSDGNETDNEAGFAESDDSDGEDEFQFWTPGRRFPLPEDTEAPIYRATITRAASHSSIDSLEHMEIGGERKLRRRPRSIKIRPGTPELPDSTDFVCGTLDEDRPMEDAYISCQKLKTNAKHKQTPQDIDPSFPTSDIEDEEDEDDDVGPANDSDEQVWLHGQFEESDEERPRLGRRRSITVQRKSPGHSPRRLRSPAPIRKVHSPPAQKRLRSPPPRKLFGHSPRRMRSPPPQRTLYSPPASPTEETAPKGISFATNFESRPGLTHTKSLPRTPNAFCRQYAASRLAAANGITAEDNNDGPIRGAIDIVKGLEQRRARRKEKFYQKHCLRKNKGHGERRPQPGKGAERMRELGLLMAGKPTTQDQDPYMMSA